MGIVSLETDTFHGHNYGNANCFYVSPIKEMTLLAHDVYDFSFHPFAAMLTKLQGRPSEQFDQR
eukprot:COSAG01_NODE_10909_length_2053_cov_51.801433_2_plen_64_part_00